LITAYRLIHESVLAKGVDPFKPEAAEARWNSLGVQVAYTAESLALAAMEMLSYWGRYRSLKGYQIFTIAIQDEDVEVIAGEVDASNYSVTRPFGDAWAREGRSLALRVPSVVLPLSFNYLINPNHSRFGQAGVTNEGPLVFDSRIERLLSRAKGR
jgi:RES domain-containing protein